VRDVYGRDDVMRYLYEDPVDEAGARDLLARKIANASIDDEGGHAFLAATEKASGAFVGDAVIGLESAHHRLVELGFVVHPDHQGRGYATEIGVELLRLGFEALDAHRVIGRTEARNAASARVLEKLGMRLEAHFVENEWVKGEWQSELVYAILDREWR
jgi:RimJ/RimL family protein N-acetyltransferase